MKKFNALLFAMALMAVVMFAYAASAATFVGVNSTNNRVATWTVNISDSGTPISRKSTVTDSPTFGRGNPGVLVSPRVKAYENLVYVVSTDTAAAGVNPNVHVFTVDSDSNVSYTKAVPAPSIVRGMSGRGTTAAGAGGGVFFTTTGVRDVIDFKGSKIFIGDSAFSMFDGNRFVSYDVSVDTAFVYNDTLYIINSGDMGANGPRSLMQGVTELTASTTSRDIADLVLAQEHTYPMRGTPIAWNDATNPGMFKSVVAGDYVYIAAYTGLYRILLSEVGVVHSPNVEKINDGIYLAANTDGTTIYAVKVAAGQAYLVSIDPSTAAETELNANLRDDVGINADVANPLTSVDVYFNPTDKIIGVVSHTSEAARNGRVAVYVPKESGSRYDFYESDTNLITAAMVLTASGTTPDTPDTPVTPTTTAQVVDVANSTAAQTAIAAAFPNVPASSFLTSDKATLGTADAISDAAKEALEAKVEDGYHVKSYNLLKKVTLTEAGYILLEGTDIQKLDSSKHVVLAFNASGTSYPVKLLNASGTVLAETATYLGAGELPAGDYNIYYAETEPDDDDSGDTGSSSSGCNAGFAAISALLALAFIKKSR